MFVSEITEQGNWLVFPKTISKHIGLVKTLLLMEHVNISDTKGGDNGWYYRTRSSLAEVLGMSDHSCKKHEDELVQQDLLKRKTSTNGVHANYYKLNKRKIKELLATASNTEGGKKVSPINNTSIDNTTYYQDTKKPESASNRNVAMKAPVVSGSSPKSSTVQKRDMLLPQRSKFKALSKDGNPRDAKKRAEIMLQPETMELLEFWNSLPYIQKHKIAYDGDKLVQLSKQSKSLQHIDKVLQEVLKGSLYKDCADISEDRYKIYKPQMPAIKMALKRYSESLNPDCNYAVKGFKIPLYKFFVFRQMSVDPALGKAKYKRKYPFLYYLSCEAKPLEQERKELSTKQPILLVRILNELKANGISNITGARYNDVVKATNLVDEIINRRLQTSDRRRAALSSAPALLFNAMRSSYGDVKLEYLYKTCAYKLEDYMTQKRFI